MQVNLNAPFNCFTSYGLTSLNLIEALFRLKDKCDIDMGHMEINAFPIGDVSYYPNQTAVPIALKNGENFIKKSDPYERGSEMSIRLYHQFSLREQVCNYRIGFPIFELDNFSELERANLLCCDEILVCSKWAQSVVENTTGQPSSVVPLGVDSSIFYPEEPVSEINGKEKPFTFFFPGKFEYRKSFDIVMDIFDKAFPTENVEILFLPQNICIKDNQEWINSLMTSNLAKKNKVKIIGRVDSPQQVSDIVRYSDAVVSFSRAEGWNLPLLEALSCGRQVIATNYSGHTEFLSSTNSLLLDVAGRETAIDGVFFNGNGNWLSYSDSDFDNFISSLRQTFQKGRKYNGAGVETAKQFSWENSARKLIEVL